MLEVVMIHTLRPLVVIIRFIRLIAILCVGMVWCFFDILFQYYKAKRGE